MLIGADGVGGFGAAPTPAGPCDEKPGLLSSRPGPSTDGLPPAGVVGLATPRPEGGACTVSPHSGGSQAGLRGFALRSLSGFFPPNCSRSCCSSIRPLIAVTLPSSTVS